MWFEKITEWMDLPEGLREEPFAGKWKGVDAHAGPSSGTKLQYELSAMRVSGLYTILAGGLVWLANRLALHTDTVPIEHLAVALFCYQQDPNYYVAPETRASLDELDSADRFRGPVLYVLDEWYEHRARSNGNWPVYIPHHMVAQMLTLTRYSLGTAHRKPFDSWLDRVIQRADALVPYLAPFTGDYEVEEAASLRLESMGMPLPPSVVSLGTEPDPSKFASEWSGFLKSVADEPNIFLRPKSELESLTFGGKPYESGR